MLRDCGRVGERQKPTGVRQTPYQYQEMKISGPTDEQKSRKRNQYWKKGARCADAGRGCGGIRHTATGRLPALLGCTSRRTA